MAYNVKFLKGAQVNFDALVQANSIDKNTFYYVDEKDLYLGSIKLSNATDVANAVSRIQINESDIELIKAELDALSGGDSGAGSITTQIAALRDELDAKIKANTDAITAETTRAEGAESALGGRIDAVVNSVDVLVDKVGTNTSSIEAINTKVADLDNLKTTVSDHTSQINTLIGEDEGLSVRAIALNELTKQLISADAQESLDTLEEIAAWIQAHPGDASAMNEAIQSNATAIEGLNGRVATNEENIQSVQTLLSQVEDLAGENQTDIASIQQLLASITNESSGILAQSKGYTDSSIEALGITGRLGSAAYQDSTAFDGAGSADAALAAAQKYTNDALTWGNIAE